MLVPGLRLSRLSSARHSALSNASSRWTAGARARGSRASRSTYQSRGSAGSVLGGVGARYTSMSTGSRESESDSAACPSIDTAESSGLCPVGGGGLIG